MQVLGIFIGTLILWLTTAIDWPSILCLAGLAFVPEQKMNGILASSFGNSTFAYGTAVAVVTVIVALVVGYPIASSVFPVV